MIVYNNTNLRIKTPVLRWITSLFLLLLSATTMLFAESVEGVGYGLTKDAAIEQAKRDAVEVGLGVYISSETVVTATTLKDNIYSKAQGFVKTFKVIRKKKDPDGNWEVTIKAEITSILDQVMQDEAALQTLLNSMNRPRIIFLIREENLIDNTPTDFAETKLLSMFYDRGFDVVDRQLVQALKGKPDYEDALSGDVAASAKVAGQLGADVIVIGTAKISSGGSFKAGPFTMRTISGPSAMASRWVGIRPVVPRFPP